MKKMLVIVFSILLTTLEIVDAMTREAFENFDTTMFMFVLFASFLLVIGGGMILNKASTLLKKFGGVILIVIAFTVVPWIYAELSTPDYTKSKEGYIDEAIRRMVEHNFIPIQDAEAVKTIYYWIVFNETMAREINSTYVDNLKKCGFSVDTMPQTGVVAEEQKWVLESLNKAKGNC